MEDGARCSDAVEASRDGDEALRLREREGLSDVRERRGEAGAGVRRGSSVM